MEAKQSELATQKKTEKPGVGVEGGWVGTQGLPPSTTWEKQKDRKLYGRLLRQPGRDKER